MNRENLIKEIIALTLEQVKEQGWEVLDATDEEATNMIFNKIKDEII